MQSMDWFKKELEAAKSMIEKSNSSEEFSEKNSLKQC